MRSPRRSPAVAAGLLAAVLASGCTKMVVFRGREMPRDEAREECRKWFASCAPKPLFKLETPVSAMSIRELVEVSSRLDVKDSLARDAVNRLRVVMRGGESGPTRQLRDAADVVEASFAQCGCGGLFPSELEAAGLARDARAAFPLEKESPEYWADRVVPQLAELRQQRHRAAIAALGFAQGPGAAPDAPGADAGAPLAEARRAVCETVREAARNLPGAELPDLFQLAYRKYAATSRGDLGNVSGIMEEDAKATSCDPAKRR